MADRMPALFVGHGNPMNALLHNRYTDAWAAWGRGNQRPQAILSISAHWHLPDLAVTATAAPRTTHDFGGFPSELSQFRYAAPGNPVLAHHVQELLAPLPVRLDDRWGLDHGTWSVLSHMYPHADIPVVQLSINETQPPAFHYNLGRRLAPLRDDGVLILGSGNLIHNLHVYAWGREAVEPYDWAVRFEQRVRDLLVSGDHQSLVNYKTLGPDAMLAIPTPEHVLPLLYVLGTCQPHERVTFPVEGIDGGSISMLAVQVG